MNSGGLAAIVGIAVAFCVVGDVAFGKIGGLGLTSFKNTVSVAGMNTLMTQSFSFSYYWYRSNPAALSRV